MKTIETDLPGCLILEPQVFGDARGFFYESFNRDKLSGIGLEVDFAQGNVSSSTRGVLRGLHYQWPRPQGKLVSVLEGEVWDVAVDIRRGSPAFGKWFGLELSDANKRMLWIPPGFAHGFCALEDGSDLVYKCTTLYDAPSDRSILWNDPEIGIEWPIREPVLSGKDAAAPRLAEASVLPIFVDKLTPR